MNSRMALEMGTPPPVLGPLPEELFEIVSDGFLEVDGVHILSSQINRQSNVSTNDFPDRTGYECFINSIHIDDFVFENRLRFALRFSDILIDVWRRYFLDRVSLNVIVSHEEMSTVVRCHVVRDNECWIAEDLEKYEEAILVVDSNFEGKIEYLAQSHPMSG